MESRILESVFFPFGAFIVPADLHEFFEEIVSKLYCDEIQKEHRDVAELHVSIHGYRDLSSASRNRLVFHHKVFVDELNSIRV